MSVWRTTWSKVPSPVQKVTVAVVGAALIVAGAVLLVLPGPGIALIVLGVAVLATEFAWAHRAHQRANAAARALLARIRRSWPSRGGRA